MAVHNIALTPILALDVGNGYGKVALLTNWDAEPTFLLPESLRQGMDTTAYVAPDGTIEVYAARTRRAARAVRAVKTRLNEEAIYLNEKGTAYQVSPNAVYAAIARDMAMLANRELRAQGREEIYDVVLTYPASFAHRHTLLAKMKQSVESVEINGHKLKVLHMISEPSAVAVEHLHFACHRAADPVTANEYTELVYDLGHGTFDAALVTAYADFAKDCELHAQDGDDEVGGRIFDKVLYDEICNSLRRQNGYEPATAKEREDILQVAGEIKRALSEEETVVREIALPNADVAVELTRARFEQLIAPYLQKSWNIVHKLLRTAQEKNIKVDAIVVSGGCSRIPCIARQLREITGGTIPVEVYKPSEAVSYGAARYGAARMQPAETPAPEKDGKATPATDAARKVLTQHADRAYGIWSPNETPAGHILYLTDAKETLPCWSKPLDAITSPSGETRLWLYCSKAYTTGQTSGAVADCDQIQQVRLALPANTPVRIMTHINEERSITVSCQLPDGKTVKYTVSGGDTAVKES